MAQAIHNISRLDPTVLELLRKERNKALSLREWKFRLAGHGYGIKEYGERHVVTRLTNGSELGMLPVNFH